VCDPSRTSMLGSTIPLANASTLWREHPFPIAASVQGDVAPAPVELPVVFVVSTPATHPTQLRSAGDTARKTQALVGAAIVQCEGARTPRLCVQHYAVSL
jgi:hypothetical protein